MIHIMKTLSYLIHQSIINKQYVSHKMYFAVSFLQFCQLDACDQCCYFCEHFELLVQDAATALPFTLVFVADCNRD